jgi:molybdopterin molybdotransferase
VACHLGLPRGAIRDDERNGNNRFEVAAELNRICSGRAFPFRLCPPGHATDFLSPRKDGWRAAAPILSERRLTEQRHRRAQPVWKLYTTGAAGSQALLGIPRGTSLRPRTCAQVPRLAV